MADEVLAMATEIVSSFVAGNQIGASELPELIRSVYQTLSRVDAPGADFKPAVERATAAEIKRSIKEDVLISFEDGRGYKTLKRHLSTRGLTFAAYKDKWGLPNDYPSTSPSYSAQRSEMARTIGLWKKGGAGKAKSKSESKAGG
jgi:predicted transcriptional regulator